MSAESLLYEQFRSLNPDVLSQNEREPFVRMMRGDLEARCRMANQRDREEWEKVKSKDDWEQFCAPRIEALRQSLGVFPLVPADLNVQVTRTSEGDGYSIENLFYESRKGVYVTANLYLPSTIRGKMPVILIVHSHHNPRTQGELQDMGMTWARQGCMVLVMDQLGYGERRQHRPGPRQDYRFRYINGIQLHVIGDSLMGWMVWDVMRGIDLLLSREGIDREKVILIGSVAGGGDVAAVAAALDRRVACVVPFNFGGPQPETEYPLPDDVEGSFNYMGYGSWESTRNLRLSGRDGFLPWVIVASVAPRRLIYAHEFSWDRERDPVWKRLQKVFAFYDASENLAFTHGAGVLSGRPPEATHCNNVGAIHRSMVHHALQRWFGIPIPEEYQNRLQEEDLMCLASESLPSRGQVSAARVPPMHSLFAEIGASRANAMRNALAELTPGERLHRLRQEWANLLGDIEPKADPGVRSFKSQKSDGIIVERILLEVESNIIVPMLGLLSDSKTEEKRPVVLALAQEGKAGFLKERREEIAGLLRNNIAVYLPDLRGVGEMMLSASRERQSGATSVSANELMLGQTPLGSRLRDTRCIIRYLRTRSELDPQRLAIWGDSFAPANPTNFNDPLIDGGETPLQSEPFGGLLALFLALYEPDIRAVASRGMVAGYQSILRDRFCYIPHDAIVPGALSAGDLSDIAAAIAPSLLRLEALVDGRNCLMTDQDLQCIFEATSRAYSSTADRLTIIPGLRDDLSVWFRNVTR